MVRVVLLPLWSRTTRGGRMTDAQYQDHNSEDVCWCVECDTYRFDAIPDGWAKLDGELVELEPVFGKPHYRRKAV